jgi:hypothetical protein
MVWHKYGIRFGPVCANMSFFATALKCFRAGLVKRKLLILKVGSAILSFAIPLTTNQKAGSSNLSGRAKQNQQLTEFMLARGTRMRIFGDA